MQESHTQRKLTTGFGHILWIISLTPQDKMGN